MPEELDEEDGGPSRSDQEAQPSTSNQKENTPPQANAGNTQEVFLIYKININLLHRQKLLSTS